MVPGWAWRVRTGSACGLAFVEERSVCLRVARDVPLESRQTRSSVLLFFLSDSLFFRLFRVYLWLLLNEHENARLR